MKIGRWMGLLLIGQVWAEHGGTQAFEVRARELREKWGNSGVFELLDAGWVREDEQYHCVLKGPEGWVRLSSETGERVALSEQPVLLDDSRHFKEEWRRGFRNTGEGSREPDPLPVTIDGTKIRIGEGESAKVLDGTLPAGWVWEGEASWSPTRSSFYLLKVRDVAMRQVHYVRSSPASQLQPEHFTIAYPKPGDELRVGVPVVFEVESGRRIELEPSLIENPFDISHVFWRSEGKLWLEYIERGFGKFRLLECEVASGQTRVVAAEEDEKLLYVYEKCGWRALGMGQLLWSSEASGYKHLYLIDEQTGERKALTSGTWEVRQLESVRGEEIYFSFSGMDASQDPYHLHWAKVNWKTGELTRLTSADGTHELRWSPDESYYIDSWSRVDHPPVHELRKAADGSLIAELGRADAAGMLKRGFTMPERFVAKDRDGLYDIHGVIWKPADFDEGKKYAVIENIYAGPQGAFVPKAWSSWYDHGSEMAAAGFVVVQIDGRGTNYRGREFQQYAYKNLKDSGFPDRIKWLKEAAASRPWMDLARVGLYGGSAGGQSTLAGLLWHGDFYQAGAADCGCHDNRMDKIWWNEQWMDWPVDESYAANSNTEHVSQLRGKLLLTVGEVDTNVDPASTLQVVNALMKADKDFEFYLVPNGEHGTGESSYLRRIRVEFFQRHLGGPI